MATVRNRDSTLSSQCIDCLPSGHRQAALAQIQPLLVTSKSQCQPGYHRRTGGSSTFPLTNYSNKQLTNFIHIRLLDDLKGHPSKLD